MGRKATLVVHAAALQSLDAAEDKLFERKQTRQNALRSTGLGLGRGGAFYVPTDTPLMKASGPGPRGGRTLGPRQIASAP